jgi:hypothetical protein
MIRSFFFRPNIKNQWCVGVVFWQNLKEIYIFKEKQ